MNIILGSEHLNDYQGKYTILELDTIRMLPENRTLTAYCIVENIPLFELPHAESKRKLHDSLMVNYRKKEWKFCNDALDHLIGSWNGEIDSFYEEIRSRIAKYIDNDPGEDWDATIEKTVTTE